MCTYRHGHVDNRSADRFVFGCVVVVEKPAVRKSYCKKCGLRVEECVGVGNRAAPRYAALRTTIAKNHTVEHRNIEH